MTYEAGMRTHVLLGEGDTRRGTVTIKATDPTFANGGRTVLLVVGTGPEPTLMVHLTRDEAYALERMLAAARVSQATEET